MGTSWKEGTWFITSLNSSHELNYNEALRYLKTLTSNCKAKTRQVSSMIHSTRPKVSPDWANIVFCCFVCLDLKSGDGRTDGQHVRKQWSLPAVTVGWPSGSISVMFLCLYKWSGSYHVLTSVTVIDRQAEVINSLTIKVYVTPWKNSVMTFFTV